MHPRPYNTSSYSINTLLVPLLVSTDCCYTFTCKTHFTSSNFSHSCNPRIGCKYCWVTMNNDLCHFDFPLRRIFMTYLLFTTALWPAYAVNFTVDVCRFGNYVVICTGKAISWELLFCLFLVFLFSSFYMRSVINLVCNVGVVPVLSLWYFWIDWISATLLILQYLHKSSHLLCNHMGHGYTHTQSIIKSFKLCSVLPNTMVIALKALYLLLWDGMV